MPDLFKQFRLERAFRHDIVMMITDNTSGTMNDMVTFVLALAIVGGSPQLRTVKPGAPDEPFYRFLASDGFTGVPAMPKLRTREDHQAATVLRDAVAHGWGVVDGGTEHERRGVNFGGHYVLVQWGCGSPCMQAALIDARDGSILKLPQIAGDEQSGYEVPTGSVDLRTLEFRWNSRLLGIPRIADGKTYYYQLMGKEWRFVNKVDTPPDHD